MEYIERYVREVGKLLPKKDKEEKLAQLRADLEKDIEKEKSGSNIIDMDTTQYEINVINKWGAPYLVAKKLGGGYRPLISAEAMPTYILVLKIVAIVHLVLIMVVWGASGFNIQKFMGVVTGMAQSLLSNAGIITIIFYFLDKADKFNTDDWKVEDLEKLPQKDRVKVPNTLISIGISSFFLMYFILFPEWIGFGYYVDGYWIFHRLESGFILTFLPFICILMITRIFLSVLEIKQEYFTPRIRIWEIVQNVAVILLSAYIIQSGTELVFEGGDAVLKAITAPFGRVSDIILAVVIFGSVVDIVKNGYALFKSTPTSG